MRLAALRPGLICALWLASAPLLAADPQSYRVEFESTGHGGMDDAIKATSDLQSLRKSGPVSPFGLIARARGDLDRLKTAVEGFGYYQSEIVIRINGIA